jgi:hypothetical protein
MPRVSGVVSTINSSNVTTKYGPKPTYTFMVDGVEYRTSFKNAGVSPGDNITFDFTAGKYGNDVDLASIQKNGTSPVPAAAPRPTVVQGGGNRGSFPVGALDGNRAINRQNALTNAIKFAEVIKYEAANVEAIVAIARKFEAYTCGDDDMAAAVQQVAQEKAAA